MRVSGGEPCGAGHGVRSLAVTIPRVASVAVTYGTDFLGVAARPLPLRSRFLITSVLSDRGRVMPWSFYIGLKLNSL